MGKIVYKLKNCSNGTVLYNFLLKICTGTSGAAVYELIDDFLHKQYYAKEIGLVKDDYEIYGGELLKIEYDMVIGGIADDRVYNTIELYKDKLIGKDEALKRLQYYKPNYQICIINQEIINMYLKFEENKEV